jgi:hypothetical protein
MPVSAQGKSKMNALEHCIKKSLAILWGSGEAATTISRSRLALDKGIWG